MTTTPISPEKTILNPPQPRRKVSSGGTRKVGKEAAKRFSGGKPKEGNGLRGKKFVSRAELKRTLSQENPKWGPAHVAAFAGGALGAEETKKWKKKDLHSLNGDGNTPLHIAAGKGNLAAVKNLLHVHRAKATAPNRLGRVPLHLAAASGRLGIVRCFLLSGRVKPHVEDKKGVTPLDLALDFGHWDIVKQLFRVGTIRDEIKVKALHVAVRKGNAEMVEWLIGERISSNVQDGNGRTALSLALNAGHLELAKWLVSRGKADPTIKDANGIDAFEDAAIMGHKGIFKQLVLHSRLPRERLKPLLVKYQKMLDKEISKYIEEIEALRGKARYRASVRQTRSQSLRHEKHYDEQAEELMKAVGELSIDDKLWLNKRNIWLQMDSIGSRKSGVVPSLLKPLLKRCVEPYLLLRTEFTSKEKRKVKKNKSYTKEHPAFTDIRKLADDLKACSKSEEIPNKGYFSPVCNALLELSGYYKGFCERFCKTATEQDREQLRKPPVRVFKLDKNDKVTQSIIVNPEIIQKIFQDEKENENGERKVFFHEGVYYKMYPYSPGVETAVDALNNLIAGEGSTPTKLIKIVDQEGKHHPVLASKSVTGVELYDIVVYRQKILSKLDMENFSKIVVLSLLVNPYDGHLHNYMGKLRVDEKGNVISWKIVGIDNDMAFTPSFTKRVLNGKTSEYALVRNVLYFFPQMKKVFDRTFRDQFIKRSPESILIDWLLALQKKNQGYQALLDRKIFDLVEYNGDKKIKGGMKNKTPYMVLDHSKNDRGLNLPICFDPETATVLYRRICQVQSWLKEDKKNELTPEDLFRKLEPNLHRIYDDLWKKHKRKTPDSTDIHQCIVDIYNGSLDLLKKRESVLSKQSGSALTRLAVATAVSEDFEKNRTRKISEIAEEWIASVDWATLPSKEAAAHLRRLHKILGIKDLSLNNCNVFPEHQLITYLRGFKALRSLTLRGEYSLGMKGLCSMLNDTKEIQVRLDVKDLKLKPEEIYELAMNKEYGQRIKLVFFGEEGKKREFSLFRNLGQPEKMMDHLIMKHCNNQQLFDTILYFLKQSNGSKEKQPLSNTNQTSLKKGGAEAKKNYLNYRYVDGTTFLHQAAIWANRWALKRLIKAGIDPTLKDKKKRTAVECWKEK